MKKLMILLVMLVLCFSVNAVIAAEVAEPAFKVEVDFSEGTFGWVPMGSPSLTLVNEEVKVGTQSLKISGRTQGWESPLFDITDVLTEGGTYQFSIFVKLTKGTPQTKGHVTLRSNDTGGTESYTWISDEFDLNDSEWVEIKTKDYKFSLVNMLKLAIYIEVNEATASFYMDDFTITGDQPIILPK